MSGWRLARQMPRIGMWVVVVATLSIAAPQDGQRVEITEVEEEPTEANWISYRRPGKRY